MHDNKPNNFYIKHFFIIFQIKKLQRLFNTFVPLGVIKIHVYRTIYLKFIVTYIVEGEITARSLETF
jgi:hypothetical protein